MSTGLIDIMKRASMDAMNNAQVCDLRYGTVVSVSPLKVQITNQFTIPSSLLIVPRHLTNYTVFVSFDWLTEDESEHTHDYEDKTEEANGHAHDYDGTTEEGSPHHHQVISEANKTITIHNALRIGDKVALIRKTGGQSYYILDRI